MKKISSIIFIAALFLLFSCNGSKKSDKKDYSKNEIVKILTDAVRQSLEKKEFTKLIALDFVELDTVTENQLDSSKITRYNRNIVYIQLVSSGDSPLPGYSKDEAKDSLALYEKKIDELYKAKESRQNPKDILRAKFHEIIELNIYPMHYKEERSTFYYFEFDSFKMLFSEADLTLPVQRENLNTY